MTATMGERSEILVYRAGHVTMQRTGLAGGGPDSAGERIRTSSAATGHDTNTEHPSPAGKFTTTKRALAYHYRCCGTCRCCCLLFPRSTKTSAFLPPLLLSSKAFAFFLSSSSLSPAPNPTLSLSLSTFSLLCTLQQPWLWIGNGNRR